MSTLVIVSYELMIFTPLRVYCSTTTIGFELLVLLLPFLHSLTLLLLFSALSLKSLLLVQYLLLVFFCCFLLVYPLPFHFCEHLLPDEALVFMMRLWYSGCKLAAK